MTPGDFTFDAQQYGPAVAELLLPRRQCALGPSAPNRAAESRLGALTPETLLNGRQVADRGMAEACLAGLWLYHDFLDRSHTISQEIHTPSGSYWHGILHRREGDYDNAKYWFRRVGKHAVFEPLRQAAAAAAAELQDLDHAAKFLATQAAWDAFRFVDLVQSAARRSSVDDLCRSIQAREWELLFDDCYRAASSVEA